MIKWGQSMIGEREDLQQEDFGNLVMRPYNIEGNDIRAFYDSSDDLIFVLDNTINESKPNVLLVINPDGDKKWDEILSGEYEIDLETIRPKQDNKYQKLDIEYSGLGVYDSLINAYIAGESLEENLNQLAILRDSAARHSAVVRLNAANEAIAKTNATIVKTKESIVRLQQHLKTLRAKLVATKKEIGKVSTKQSASKVLKIESQIEAVTEKLNRAKSRLASAQRRLEVATVDAELASNVLNRPPLENKNTKKVKTMPMDNKHEVKSLPVEPEYEVDDDSMADEVEENTEESVEDLPVPVVQDEEENSQGEDEEIIDEEENSQDADEDEQETDEEEDSDVKPLFDEDPQIMDEKIAFKPVLLDAPDNADEMSQLPAVVEEEQKDFAPEKREEPMPNENNETLENKPVLESMTPVENNVEEPATEDEELQINIEEQKPVIDMMKPIQEPEDEDSKQEEPKPAVDIIKPVNNVPLPSENEEQEVKLEADFQEDEVLTAPQEPVAFAPVEADKMVDESEAEKEPEEQTVRQPVMEESQRPRPVSPQLSNPAVAPAMPVANNVGTADYTDSKPRKPSLFYYVLLILLIGLSIFTLWLYQKNVEPTTPELTAAAGTETTSVLRPKAKKAEKAAAPVETVFLDEVKEEPAPVEEEVEEAESVIEEPEETEEPEEFVAEEVAPVVEDAVPAHLTTSGFIDEEDVGQTEDEILASKPVFEPGGKDIGTITEQTEEDVGFVEEPEEVVAEEVYQDDMEYQNPEEEMMVNPDSLEYDEEEAMYQAEQANMEYEE